MPPGGSEQELLALRQVQVRWADSRPVHHVWCGVRKSQACRQQTGLRWHVGRRATGRGPLHAAEHVDTRHGLVVWLCPMRDHAAGRQLARSACCLACAPLTQTLAAVPVAGGVD
jgi:hypothetical protein